MIIDHLCIYSNSHYRANRPANGAASQGEPGRITPRSSPLRKGGANDWVPTFLPPGQRPAGRSLDRPQGTPWRLRKEGTGH